MWWWRRCGGNIPVNRRTNLHRPLQRPGNGGIGQRGEVPAGAQTVAQSRWPGIQEVGPGGEGNPPGAGPRPTDLQAGTRRRGGGGGDGSQVRLDMGGEEKLGECGGAGATGLPERILVSPSTRPGAGRRRVSLGPHGPPGHTFPPDPSVAKPGMRPHPGTISVCPLGLLLGTRGVARRAENEGAGDGPMGPDALPPQHRLP